MTDRQPTTAFWLTVALVAVLVAYPLSFGPACWLAIRYRSTLRGSVFMRPYCPLPSMIVSEFGKSAGSILLWYAGLFGDGARTVAVDLMFEARDRAVPHK